MQPLGCPKCGGGHHEDFFELAGDNSQPLLNDPFFLDIIWHAFADLPGDLLRHPDLPQFGMALAAAIGGIAGAADSRARHHALEELLEKIHSSGGDGTYVLELMRMPEGRA